MKSYLFRNSSRNLLLKDLLKPHRHFECRLFSSVSAALFTALSDNSGAESRAVLVVDVGACWLEGVYLYQHRV